jgi:hypothetical protein
LKDKIKRIDDLSSNVWAEGASSSLSVKKSATGTSERVEKSIRYYWKELKCSKLYPSNRNVFEDPEDNNLGGSSTTIAHRRTEEATIRDNVITRDRCREWMKTHHVVPGNSWGTLPVNLQK